MPPLLAHKLQFSVFIKFCQTDPYQYG